MNLETYINEPRQGTRAELPMHEGALIMADRKYTVTGSAAVKAASKYPDGFKFSADHAVEYVAFTVNGEKYWFFIETF